MTKQLWLNLPVKDLKTSKKFFLDLGFSLNTQYGNSPVSAGFVIGKTVVMLFEEKMFKGFINNNITSTNESNEMLISIDAETKSEVDEIAEKASRAGGIVFAAPAEKDGWMYGCGFKDPDGHRWNVLYMDITKMPK